MKKTVMIVAALCLACIGAAAQNTWFAKDAGTKLNYEQKDAAGKTQNSFTYTVTSCTTEGGKTVISYDMLVPVLNKTISCNVWSEDGWFHSDAAGSMGSDLKVTGNVPMMPENPSAGQKLEDCTVSIESLATKAEYTKVAVTKHEDVTTPAGTFDCWCLEYSTSTTMPFIKAVVNNTEQWMAKGVGVVKTVVKDKKGTVQSVTELVSIEK